MIPNAGASSATVSSQTLIVPVIAIGTVGGTVYLLNVATLQVHPLSIL